MAFTLPDLPYAFDALEPAIDARTMEIHHGKHHAGYVAKLNAAIAGHADLESMSIEALCSGLGSVPAGVQGAVRNNGGGHYNHSLFWSVMGPAGSGGAPGGALADAINGAFGDLDGMKKAFSGAAATRFGSGWAWVAVQGGKLVVGSTANQDNPLMGEAIAGMSGTPILGLDVWEHAYYLNYQNRRPDYIAAWWSIVNWKAVADRFAAAT